MASRHMRRCLTSLVINDTETDTCSRKVMRRHRASSTSAGLLRLIEPRRGASSLFSLTVLRRSHLPTPWLWTSSLELWDKALAVLSHLVCGTLFLQPLETNKFALWLFVKCGQWQALEGHGREGSRKGQGICSGPLLAKVLGSAALFFRVPSPYNHPLWILEATVALCLFRSRVRGAQRPASSPTVTAASVHTFENEPLCPFRRESAGWWHILLGRTLTNVAPLLPKSIDYHLLVLLLDRVHVIALTTF